MNAGTLTWVVQMLKNWVGASAVPTGFAIFLKDILPPREMKRSKPR